MMAGRSVSSTPSGETPDKPTRSTRSGHAVPAKRVARSASSRNGAPSGSRRVARSASSGTHTAHESGRTARSVASGAVHTPHAAVDIDTVAASHAEQSMAASQPRKRRGSVRSVFAAAGDAVARRRSAKQARAQVKKPRIVEERIGATSPGAFVDANNLPSEDMVAKTLQETAGTIGVATRPKVVDFAARQKEQRKADTRRIAARVAVVCAAMAAVIALVWLLFFSPVLRLEPNNISASGANEWVSNEQIMAIAKRQAGKSLLVVSDSAVEQKLSQIPGVSSATAEKKFPNGLHVSVTAQRPAAMLKEPSGSTMTAVDSKARKLNAVNGAAQSVQGIPVIEVDDVGKALSRRAVQSALVILDALPESMRNAIVKVQANTQDSITTQLDNGISIVWGDDSDLKLKMAIVDKIMNDPNVIGDKKQINVSATARPIIK
ncbi:FtsQ-type POTRA domain-containing protein [Bifidobacterium pseudolongum]|uniref:cell division protein FtsQ/DivIB n=1 Tax=Bifidobacterium pseudolongum TaxID=1694 RepID=UPI001CE0F1E3|nr:FtsQ-type POTRA domain-containing protein [Bifidobacterium pseudolongum]UBZ05250.1 FtsQ-type POTRA domain-containing protein [Bifidobacterium pseudolongum]